MLLLFILYLINYHKFSKRIGKSLDLAKRQPKSDLETDVFVCLYNIFSAWHMLLFQSIILYRRRRRSPLYHISTVLREQHHIPRYLCTPTTPPLLLARTNLPFFIYISHAWHTSYTHMCVCVCVHTTLGWMIRRFRHFLNVMLIYFPSVRFLFDFSLNLGLRLRNNKS